MDIDILGGLPHNYIAKKNKNKLSWIHRPVKEEKQRL